MQKKTFITTARDSRKTTGIDVTKLYRHYCKSFRVKKFSELKSPEGSVLLKKIINDFSDNLISLHELSALCDYYFFEYAMRQETEERELSLLLADVYFEMRVDEGTANSWLKEAFEFAGKEKQSQKSK